jgi:hypothetical protein
MLINRQLTSRIVCMGRFSQSHAAALRENFRDKICKLLSPNVPVFRGAIKSASQKRQRRDAAQSRAKTAERSEPWVGARKGKALKGRSRLLPRPFRAFWMFYFDWHFLLHPVFRIPWHLAAETWFGKAISGKPVVQ